MALPEGVRTELQLKIYESVANIRLKTFLVYTSAAVFVVVAICLIFNPNWYYTVFDSVLGISIGPVFRHYFPDLSSRKNKDKSRPAP